MALQASTVPPESVLASIAPVGFVPLPLCRFLPSDVKEGELRDEYGYTIFEPKVVFEIQGRNAFEVFGIHGVQNVVIMHFREEALRETLRLVNQADWRKGQSEHRYWFLGTAYGIGLERRGENLEVFVEVDGNYGPVKTSVEWPTGWPREE
jgi:hypothetical protein